MNLSFYNIDRFCSNINLRSQCPRIDLSRLKFIEPFAVIYLGQFIRYHNRRGKYFELTPPDNARVVKYLNRIRFSDRFKFDRDKIESEGLLEFTSTTSLNDIVDLIPTPYVGDDTAALVEQVIRRSSVRLDHSAVLEVVAELADNFAQHAEVDLATLAVQYYPNLHEFAIGVGDCGRGMKSTLVENPSYAYLKHRPHHEAITKAFEPLVSRRACSGTGLTNVLDLVRQLGGELKIASNDGFVHVGGKGPRRGWQYYDLPGVQVEVRFPERKKSNG